MYLESFVYISRKNLASLKLTVMSHFVAANENKKKLPGIDLYKSSQLAWLSPVQWPWCEPLPGNVDRPITNDRFFRTDIRALHWKMKYSCQIVCIKRHIMPSTAILNC